MQRTARTITCLAALAFAGASFAHEPATQDHAKPAAAKTPAAPKDATKFCYYADQAYSEGSERVGATCQRVNSTTVFDRSNLPLSWVRAPQIRSIHPKLSDEN